LLVAVAAAAAPWMDMAAAAAALADIARQQGHLAGEHLLKAYCL
jgi:hypothetical protein